MRLTALIAAAMIAGALPAHAEWKEYVFKDLGIAKDFPVEPVKTTGTWGEGMKNPLSKIVPSTIYTAQDEGVTYKMIVVNFPGRDNEGSNLMNEAVYFLAKSGPVIFSDYPRVNLGPASVYGLNMVIDETATKNRVSSMVFFNKGMLYILQAGAPIAEADTAGANIFRFTDTIRFGLEERQPGGGGAPAADAAAKGPTESAAAN